MKLLRIARIAALLVLPFLAISASFAQNVTGSLTGVVSDPSGAVVIGANVTAQNTATGVKTSAVTNGAGIYTIRFLQVGSYSLIVDAKGFATSTITGITLEIDQTAQVDVSLKITTSSSVSVNDTAHPILDTEDVQLGTTLSQTEIENIPLNGRNFSSLTLFEPGADGDGPTGLTGNNAIERSTYNSDVVSINGNRQQANNYTIEGADNNEPQNNLIAYNIAPDAVGELRVVTGNANATYGNGNGGTIVAAIKSGTNSFHGSAYEYPREPNFRCEHVVEQLPGQRQESLHAEYFWRHRWRADHPEQAFLLRRLRRHPASHGRHGVRFPAHARDARRRFFRAERHRRAALQQPEQFRAVT